MSSPMISVIVPSYNHSAFVKTLIDSIYSQTFKDFELIVLDDGSTDGSPALIEGLSKKHGFKFISKQNEGLCKTLNRGLELACGKYTAIIASDDYIPVSRFAEQVAFMEANPDVDVVAGSTTLVDNEGKIRGYNSPAVKGDVTLEDMLKINRVLAATAFVRSSIYSKYGKYNPEYVFEDYHMWLKILSQGGRIVNTNNMWAFYRISNPDMEKKFNWYYKGAVQAISEFKTHPKIGKYLERHKFVFSVKLVLLLGTSAYKKYSEVLSSLNFLEKIIVVFVAVSPKIVRNKIMLRLKLRV